jgi:hypothetical protein
MRWKIKLKIVLLQMIIILKMILKLREVNYQRSIYGKKIKVLNQSNFLFLHNMSIHLILWFNGLKLRPNTNGSNLYKLVPKQMNSFDFIFKYMHKLFKKNSIIIF